MRKQKYIVIGKYDCEKNNWIEGGDIRRMISGHHSRTAAWWAAHRAHRNLGGCDGSDMLSKVMVRAPRGYEPIESDDTYSHDGTLYIGCDYWEGHEIIRNGMRIVAVPK